MSAGPKMAVLWQMVQPYRGEVCVLGGGDSDFVEAAAVWQGVGTAGRGQGFWRAAVLLVQSLSRG